jgi:hypothetical protein
MRYLNTEEAAKITGFTRRRVTQLCVLQKNENIKVKDKRFARAERCGCGKNGWLIPAADLKLAAPVYHPVNQWTAKKRTIQS